MFEHSPSKRAAYWDKVYIALYWKMSLTMENISEYPWVLVTFPSKKARVLGKGIPLQKKCKKNNWFSDPFGRFSSPSPRFLDPQVGRYSDWYCRSPIFPFLNVWIHVSRFSESYCSPLGSRQRPPTRKRKNLKNYLFSCVAQIYWLVDPAKLYWTKQNYIGSSENILDPAKQY